MGLKGSWTSRGICKLSPSDAEDFGSFKEPDGFRSRLGRS